MSRLETCFTSLAKHKKKALIPYIVAGDPQKNMTLSFMNELVSSGASVLELGLPFSDPMADGPSNQLGHERALKNKVTTKDVLQLVTEFRKSNEETPVVLMGYLNPIEVYGYQNFARDAAQAGIDGLLIVDLPPEEAEDLKSALKQENIDLIFLIAPTTTEERMKLIAEQASGFLYYVSLKGVTGAGHLNIEEVQSKIQLIRSITALPINVGFGIKDGESAKKLSEAADGVIVGSVLVDQCAKGTQQEIVQGLTSIVSEIRHSLDTKTE